MAHSLQARSTTAILPEDSTTDDIAERQAISAVVRQALAKLPRQQRALLVLRYAADLPGAEIAELLGCSPGTVKTHAHRGLRTLRELLSGDLELRAVNEPRASQRESG